MNYIMQMNHSKLKYDKIHTFNKVENSILSQPPAFDYFVPSMQVSIQNNKENEEALISQVFYHKFIAVYLVLVTMHVNETKKALMF